MNIEGYNFDNLDFEDHSNKFKKQMLEVVEKIEEYTKLVKDAITYDELQDMSADFKILTRYIACMTEILDLQDSDLPEDEIEARLEALKSGYIELDVSYEDNQTESSKDLDINENKNNDDNSLDW